MELVNGGQQPALPGFEFLELLDHPAVIKHGRGVSSLELQDFVDQMAEIAQARILTVGHEQYGQGKLQKFESMSGATLGEGLIEELADVINYFAMIVIKYLALIRRLENRISESV